MRPLVVDSAARLIFEEKSGEGSSRIPRVAMEIREMKDVAPSKWSDVEHGEQIKPLRQTLFRLSTRGQSRGIMVLGSTQKVTDLYRSIRSNMGIEVVLQLSRSGLNVPDDSHQFTHRERSQILGFSLGQGMLFNPESSGPTYPIYFAGARCGLGDKDREWLDRYGIAFGARVREYERASWRETGDEQYWINAITGEVNDVDVAGAPPVDERLKWYLLPQDVEAVTPGDMLACPHAPLVEEAPSVPRGEKWHEMAKGGEQVGEVVRRAAMLRRREYPVSSDLLPRETPFSDRERHMEMQSASTSEETALEARFEAAEVPAAVRSWSGAKPEKVERMLDVLRAIRDNEYTSQHSLAETCGVSDGSISNYLTNKRACAQCIEDPGRYEPYQLSTVGKRVLDIDWSYVLYGESSD